MMPVGGAAQSFTRSTHGRSPIMTAMAPGTSSGSMLNLYRAALAERRRNPALGDGTLTWDDDAPDGVLSFTREPGFRCVVNFGPGSVRDSRRCRGSRLVRPLRSPFGGDGRGGLVARLGCGASLPTGCRRARQAQRRSMRVIQ